MFFDSILKTASLPNPIEILPLNGGANNRVYKLTFADIPPLVCKQYFQDPNDPRQRLQGEYSFLQYAWGKGIRNIPEPILAHSETNMALYSFSMGKPITFEDITDSAINQTIDFFLKLNRDKQSGINLPRASESCLSLNEFLQITEKRIQLLQNINLENPLTQSLHTFLQTALYPKWIQIKNQVCKAALHSKLSLTKILAQNDQCISPSDFGFHNALLKEKETVVFIDFEYAGWDDPCKMVCDFFCQPKIPIPDRYFSFLTDRIASTMQNPEQFLKRVKIIFPVMQIKWCCILLNAFTQVGKNRRLFAFPEELEKQERQLALSKQLFEKIQA